MWFHLNPGIFLWIRSVSIPGIVPPRIFWKSLDFRNAPMRNYCVSVYISSRALYIPADYKLTEFIRLSNDFFFFFLLSYLYSVTLATHETMAAVIMKEGIFRSCNKWSPLHDLWEALVLEGQKAAWEPRKQRLQTSNFATYLFVDNVLGCLLEFSCLIEMRAVMLIYLIQNSDGLIICIALWVLCKCCLLMFSSLQEYIFITNNYC